MMRRLLNTSFPSGFLAYLSFLILIPLSFIYYYYSSEGIFPNIPFKPQRLIPLILSPVLLVATGVEWWRNPNARRVTSGFPLACLCLLGVWGATAAGAWRFAGKTDAAGESVNLFQLQVACQYLIYFATGCQLLGNLNKRRSTLAFFILTLGCVALSFSPSTLSIRLSRDNGCYLFLGDACAIWSLWTLAVVKPRWRGLIVFAGLLAVACLVSRTALVAYALTAIIWLFSTPKAKWFALITILVALVALASNGLKNSRLLRGYKSFSPNDATKWKVLTPTPSGKDNVFPLRGERHGARFEGDPTTRFMMGFEKTIIEPKLAWDILPAADRFNILIVCDTTQGPCCPVYEYARGEKNQTPYITSDDKSCQYIHIPLAPDNNISIGNWTRLQRDVEADLRRFYPDRELVRVLAIQVYGLGAIANIQSGSKEERFLTRHLYQFNARLKQMSLQLPDLRENWFWGDYAGQTRHFEKTIGHYIHNYLSFWRQYGLIPFLLFVGLYLTQYIIIGVEYFRNAYRNWVIEWREWRAGFRVKSRSGEKRKRRYARLNIDNPASLFTFLLATFNLIEIVFARSYATPYAWMSLGLMPAYLGWRYANGSGKQKR